MIPMQQQMVGMPGMRAVQPQPSMPPELDAPVDEPELSGGGTQPQEGAQDEPQEQEHEPGQPEPDGQVSPPPVDPITAILDGIASIPGPDAIRRVYQLSTSAAQAKARLRTLSTGMDARAYHAAISASPEAKYAIELVEARRELDTLAQERRRLNTEADKARQSGRNAAASMHELQSSAATSAMEQIAGGVLLFLALPAKALNPSTESRGEPSGPSAAQGMQTPMGQGLQSADDPSQPQPQP